jgi:hypothetical protein
MKRIIISIILAAGFLMPSPQAAIQKSKKAKKSTQAEAKVGNAPKEIYTGTIVSMRGGLASTGFTLELTGRTNDEEAARYRAILADQGQDDLLKIISKNNLGYIAATGQTRRDLLVIREGDLNGSRRIIAAFERWQGFWEVRGGYRSQDYPFSLIEIVFDQKGRGTGTFVGLVQVSMKTDKKTGQVRLDLENFGSFPSKVMGVMRRN